MERRTRTTTSGGSNVETIELNPVAPTTLPIQPITVVDESGIEPPGDLSQWAMIAALNAALFVCALDSTVVSTAAPTMSTDLHSGAGYVWIGGAYLLGMAISGPIVGSMSDIWGRKPNMLFAVAGFFITSIMCALAPNMSTLLAGRAIQGVAAGGIFQMVNAVTADLFSPRKRALYFTIEMLTWSVASGCGPVLGGIFSEKLSWRWCFWINLPFAGAALPLLFFFLNVHNPRTPFLPGIKAFDWLGTVLTLSSILLFLIGLEIGGQETPWSSPMVVSFLVCGVVAFGVLVLVEKTIVKHPILYLEMFRTAHNSAALAISFIDSFVAMACDFFLPLFLQFVKQASPVESGVLTLPFTIAGSVAGVLCGAILNKLGSYRTMIWAGSALLALGSGLLILLHSNASVAVIIRSQAIIGFAAGVLRQPVLLAIQSTVRGADLSSAISMFGLSRTISSTMSAVIAGAVFQDALSKELPKYVHAVNASSAIVANFTGNNAFANVKQIGLIEDFEVKAAVQEAYAASFSYVWIFLTAISALGIVASVFIQKGTLSEEHEEHRPGLHNE